LEATPGRILVFRVPEGVELNSYLVETAEKHGIVNAWVNVMGSLVDPVVAYYDREKGEYVEKMHRGTYELASGMGNITLREGKPMLHLHVVLGGPDNNAIAGHLSRAKVYMVEAFLMEFKSVKPLERRREGSLWVWPVEERLPDS
jgi:predicted DNA-binding protein with PD1-like motif